MVGGPPAVSGVLKRPKAGGDHLACTPELPFRAMEVTLERRANLSASASERAMAVLEDAEIPHLFERAVEPPGVAEPTGEWRDRDIALARLAESARPISEMVSNDVGDLWMKVAPHPIFGPLDGVQWALLAAAHNERHRSEIIRLAGLAASAQAA